MRRIVAILLLLILGLSVASPEVFAKEGKLQKFEKEVGREPSKETSTDSGSSYTDTSSSVSGTDVATDAAMSMFYSLLLAGLMNGMTETPGELYQFLKFTDSPALPSIRVEPSYQYVFDNIHGVIGKVEAGYLTFGVDGEYIRYFESDAPDLSIISGHFLLRTLFAKVIGVNLALGVKSIWGANRRTGFEFGFPLYLYFSRHFYFDVQPYFAYISGNKVYDIAGGISAKYNIVGARVAYRAIRTGGQTLHGPQVGVFIQW